MTHTQIALIANGISILEALNQKNMEEMEAEHAKLDEETEA